jgi:putative Holliday junction resolvase
MSEGRIMGIDYGGRRVGIALSDPLGIIASGLESINWQGKDNSRVLNRIAEICTEYDVHSIILGLPRRTDGLVGTAELKVREFAKELADKTGLEVIFADERYTTVMATRIMQESNIRREKRRSVVDQIAAEIILQSWLDQHRRNHPDKESKPH